MARNGDRIIADTCVREEDCERGSCRWVCGWTIQSPRSARLRIAIEIDDTDDALVCVRVNEELVFAGVPPWIANRRLGRRVGDLEDLAWREAFYDGVADAVTREVVGRLARR